MSLKMAVNEKNAQKLFLYDFNEKRAFSLGMSGVKTKIELLRAVSS